MNKELSPSKTIQLLPEHLVDQIKAGEVVERASALLKELLENAIDANANLIDIEIKDNGLELIKVQDNGDGMDLADLPYAFCRHATSKISRFEDLYSLSSFGFRGEALASIASSSRLTCVSSKKNSSKLGGKIIIHGGLQKSLSEQAGRKHGTSLYIKDLFFNTPARLKFIKSKISEKNSLKRVINAFMLSNPKVTFKVRWDDSDKKTYLKVDPTQTISRVSDILFKKSEANKELISFQKTYDNYFVEGHVSILFGKGGAGKNQFLFINGRLFTDKSIHQSIIRAMDKIWTTGVGHYFISLTLPPDEIDVNVHPNKTLIKFNKPGQVSSLISASLKEALSHKPQIVANLVQDATNLFFPNKEEVFLDYLQTRTENTENHSTTVFPSTNKYTGLTNKYCLINDENILINKNSLLRNFLSKNILSGMNLNIDDALPLLIGEPFRFTNKSLDHYLPLLAKLLFNIERIDNDLLILRSTPPFLDFLPAKYFIEEFLQYLEKLPQEASADSFNKIIKFFCTNLSRFGEKLTDNEIIVNLYEKQKEADEKMLYQNRTILKINNEFLDELFQ